MATCHTKPAKRMLSLVLSILQRCCAARVLTCGCSCLPHRFASLLIPLERRGRANVVGDRAFGRREAVAVGIRGGSTHQGRYFAPRTAVSTARRPGDLVDPLWDWRWKVAFDFLFFGVSYRAVSSYILFCFSLRGDAFLNVPLAAGALRRLRFGGIFGRFG